MLNLVTILVGCVIADMIHIFFEKGLPSLGGLIDPEADNSAFGGKKGGEYYEK